MTELGRETRAEKEGEGEWGTERRVLIGETGDGPTAFLVRTGLRRWARNDLAGPWTLGTVILPKELGNWAKGPGQGHHDFHDLSKQCVPVLILPISTECTFSRN